CCQPLICKGRAELLKSHFLPVMEKLRKRAEQVLMEEESMKAEGVSEAELQIQEKFTVLVRDLYAFYPLLIPFVDFHGSSWQQERSPDAEQMFSMVAQVFTFWAKSHNFKWEEQNYVVQNQINNLAFLANNNMAKLDYEERAMKKKGDGYSVHTSLIVACVKRLLPVGLRLCLPADHSLILLAKSGFAQKNTEDEIRDRVCESLLHSGGQQEIFNSDNTSHKILGVARVLYHLDQVEHPHRHKKTSWHKVLTKQRKQAVVACLRMAPLYNLPRHRAVNLFLQGYRQSWIAAEDKTLEESLVDHLACMDHLSQGMDHLT
ncbi:ryanodine receptor 2, partial [Nerophis lumbriciformis]|uniref:ryanodine receptor 2 n=1 Tax=Nerophis lumbriciformis TaxID=546530 RepID=UPI003BAD505C